MCIRDRYYVDDGYTGRNFNRPSFQRMIADIEAGKVGCVVTKDLSRLGRNYIEAGSYIEIFFPMFLACFRLRTLLEKYTKQIFVSMEAEMRAQRMRCVPLEKKPEQ